MYSEYYSNKAYNFGKFHSFDNRDIFWHVKDKNRVFTGYEIFATGKILVFHQRLNNKLG